MAEGDDKESKTEAPTHKRYLDAAEKGNIPFSREITVFASTLAIYVYVIFYLPSGVSHMMEVLRDLFEHPEQWRFETSPDIIALFVRLGWESGSIIFPALVLMMVFGLGSSVLQNTPSPILNRIQPQFSRISPVAGFNRIFGMPGMVEFGKSFFKVLVVSVIVFFAMRSEFYRALDAMFADPSFLVTKLMDNTKSILLIVLVAAGIIGVADYFWTNYHWYTELKMTKEEVKEERKQSEGDPIVKARQRSIARDRARKRMMAAVPRATLVIANPTHYAVALRYVREENVAPVVVAMGTDLVALKIREIAEGNGIPVFEDPPLARSMFAQVSVDSVIPAVFYKAVAELIQRIYASRKTPSRRNQ
jgi:flagellar biosynthetic protein FlhB